jgi:hypothetical protein
MAEGTSYGEHAFLLDGRFFSRFNAKERGLVVYAEEALRDALLESKPDTYFTTDHYRGHPYVLARLERLPRVELAALFEAAFRKKARAKRVTEYDARRPVLGSAARARASSGARSKAGKGSARSRPRPRPSAGTAICAAEGSKTRRPVLSSV